MQTLLKHHRVACLCEVSPYSEQYSQSLPLYKSESLTEKSLLHVLQFVFPSPHLKKCYAFESSPKFVQKTKTQNPVMKCMVTSEMQMSTTQILLSTLYMFVDCCLLLHLMLPLVHTKICDCSICTVS